MHLTQWGIKAWRDNRKGQNLLWYHLAIIESSINTATRISCIIINFYAHTIQSFSVIRLRKNSNRCWILSHLLFGNALYSFIVHTYVFINISIMQAPRFNAISIPVMGPAAMWSDPPIWNKLQYYISARIFCYHKPHFIPRIISEITGSNMKWHRNILS